MINKKQLLFSYLYLAFGIGFEGLILLLYKNSIINENTLIIRLILFIIFSAITVLFLYNFKKHHAKQAHFLDAILNFAGVIAAMVIACNFFDFPPTLAIHNSILTLIFISIYCISFYQLYLYFKNKDTPEKTEMILHGYVRFKYYSLFKSWAYIMFVAFCFMAIINLFFPIWDMLYMFSVFLGWFF